jgi:hypothetical protein
MKNANWKEIAELVGLAAIVASLIFVGLQMQQDRQYSIVDTRSSVSESIINFASLIQSNSDVWIRGLDGEDLTLADNVEFTAMIEAVESQYFQRYLRASLLGGIPPEFFTRNYAYALYIHPGLRRVFSEEQSFVSTRAAAFGENSPENIFYDQIKDYLHELDSNPSPPKMERRYIF